MPSISSNKARKHLMPFILTLIALKRKLLFKICMFTHVHLAIVMQMLNVAHRKELI